MSTGESRTSWDVRLTTLYSVLSGLSEGKYRVCVSEPLDMGSSGLSEGGQDRARVSTNHIQLDSDWTCHSPAAIRDWHLLVY